MLLLSLVLHLSLFYPPPLFSISEKHNIWRFREKIDPADIHTGLLYRQRLLTAAFELNMPIKYEGRETSALHLKKDHDKKVQNSYETFIASREKLAKDLLGKKYKGTIIDQCIVRPYGFFCILTEKLGQDLTKKSINIHIIPPKGHDFVPVIIEWAKPTLYLGDLTLYTNQEYKGYNEQYKIFFSWFEKLVYLRTTFKFILVNVLLQETDLETEIEESDDAIDDSFV